MRPEGKKYLYDIRKAGELLAEFAMKPLHSA